MPDKTVRRWHPTAGINYIDPADEANAAADRVDAASRAGPPPGWRIDPSPYDVRDPRRYDVPPRDMYPADALGGSAHARASHGTGSPYTLERLTCPCGRGGTYFGRIDQLPADWRCRRCT